MAKIIGNKDGINGRNDSYKIGGRPKVKREIAVQEVKDDKHPGYHTMKINNNEYVRDNPDKSKIDNVNKK